MGAAAPSLLLLVLLPLAAVVVFIGLVALSRWLRGRYRRVAGRLGRWMGPRAARALGWVAVVVVTWLVASGLLLNGLAALADRSFSVRNSATAEGVEPPASGLRLGGPGSLVAWESLGRQGQYHRHRSLGRCDRRLERDRGPGAGPGLCRHRLGRGRGGAGRAGRGGLGAGGWL